MKGQQSPEEIAFECLYGMHRSDFSRAVFNAVLNDDGATGQALRKMHTAIAKCIKADRAAQEAIRTAQEVSKR